MEQLTSLPFSMIVLTVVLAVVATWRYAAAVKPVSIGRASRTYRANFFLTALNGVMLFSILGLMIIRSLAVISGGS